MNRRGFIKGLAALPVVSNGIVGRVANAAAKQSFGPLQIAFGSCIFQDQPQPLWKGVADCQPDLFVLLGDNIYADTSDMKVMRAKYDMQIHHPDFLPIRSQIPIVATWDDHDFGGNDFGGDFAMKAQSKAEFLRFMNEPEASPRRHRDGVYASYFINHGALRVQIILLDMRWSRSPLKPDKDPTTYLPDYSPEKTFLGAAQWAWLEEQLQMPADVRLIGSGVGFVSSDHRFEKWANFPLEKLRLMSLIDDLKLKNVVIISGDVHFGEMSSERTPGGYKIVDFASSGINRFQSAKWIPNSKRIVVDGQPLLWDHGFNFGMVTIDEKARQIRLALKDASGIDRLRYVLPLEKTQISS